MTKTNETGPTTLTDAELDHVGAGAFNEVYNRGIVISRIIQKGIPNEPIRGLYARLVAAIIPSDPVTPTS
jgi:hypothetical protein